MPRLLRRKLRCHYCNVYSRNQTPGIPRTWLCRHCDAVNYLDEFGEITDPPVQEIAPSAPVHYAFSRSPSPDMSAPTEPLFCDTCQRNQLLLNKTLAEYIPDEDDPEYDKYAASAEQYRAELEERYPQVCEDCLGRVNEQIRAAGYAAKADHLRRILEKSSKHRSEVQTSRQFWTLAIVGLAKWMYIGSILVGLFWHTFGMMIAPEAGLFEDGHFNWSVCIEQAYKVREIDQSCFTSPSILKLVRFALSLDLLTLWWNPKLKQKTNRIGGRMRGLTSLWIIRIAVLALRYLCLQYLVHPVMNDETSLNRFHQTHGIMLAVLLLSTLLTYKTVRIVYMSTTIFRRSPGEHLASASRTSEKQAYQPVRPENSSFDTMAQSFTSSFAVDNLVDGKAAYPPSPTLTSTSTFTHESDYSTPYIRKKSAFPSDDTMDWTPTQKRFATHTTSVLPSQYGQLTSQSPPQQSTHEPHSIFSKPDPNPFRHKVPAAPKAPAQARANPWKPGVWAPPLKETTQNFFQQDRKVRESSTGLEGVGVPKNVKRDAELFEKPKFKYDYYGTMKDTGLEGSFNDLFSK